jgi:hypothetical protein
MIADEMRQRVRDAWKRVFDDAPPSASLEDLRDQLADASILTVAPAIRAEVALGALTGTEAIMADMEARATDAAAAIKAKARAEALEEAARVAEGQPVTVWSGHVTEVTAYGMAKRDIAAAIRAMADKALSRNSPETA